MLRCRYLKHMREAIDDSRRQTDGGPVTLLAHSAGGWLARVYLLSFGTEGWPLTGASSCNIAHVVTEG